MGKKPSISQFPFNRLRHYTKREAEVYSLLATSFSSGGTSSLLLDQVNKTFKKYLGDFFRVDYESLSESSFEQFCNNLPERFVCLVVSLTPMSKKVIIEVDPELSLVFIDKLLGGSGFAPQMGYPLTSLEEGVLQFLTVKILKEMNPFIGGGKYKLRFDKIETKNQKLSLYEDQNEPFVFLTFRIQVDQIGGTIRIGLSYLMLQDMGLALTGTSLVAKEQKSRHEEQQFRNFEHFRTVVWAEIGRVTLAAGELAELEKGDIILFDDTNADFINKSLSGDVRVRIGDGTFGGMDARIVSSGDKYKVQIKNVFNE